LRDAPPAAGAPAARAAGAAAAATAAAAGGAAEEGAAESAIVSLSKAEARDMAANVDDDAGGVSRESRR